MRSFGYWIHDFFEYHGLGLLQLVRRVVYFLGFRPKQGSLFYSPSLKLIYKLKEFQKNSKKLSKEFKKLNKTADRITHEDS